MQHFSHLSKDDIERLFFLPPADFTKESPREILSSALGATIYIPGIRKDLVGDVKKMAAKGATSVVLCLEDSIPDDQVSFAQENIKSALRSLGEMEDRSKLPLIFVRVRTPEHFLEVAQENEFTLHVLTGFVFPKFEDLSQAATRYSENFHQVQQNHIAKGHSPLYFMPVMESPVMVFRETRDEVLMGIRKVLDSHHDNVLAVRLGTTDISSPFALRRSRDLTIYNVHVVASAIADVVNYFGRADGGYVITGSVWEHFADRERIFKTQLRSSPFATPEEEELRKRILLEDLDGLIKEIEIDRANGLMGKTVIHPSHVHLVNSMSVVSHEEYSDAMDILHENQQNGGASASSYKNKMNEQKPHAHWARKTLLKAQVFGVSSPDYTLIDFLEAGLG